MSRHIPRCFRPVGLFLTLAAVILLMSAEALAQCPVTEMTSGLQIPLGITQSNNDNMLVAESGTSVPNSGRISIVDLSGNRRTLLDGLPSGINDVGEPSGPAGLFMRGRTLFVAIGVGDAGVAGPFPGTTVQNPAPPSSPIFSSVLVIRFSARVERTTAGFALAAAHHHTLATGGKVVLSNGNGDRVTIKLIADFPDFISNPLPMFTDNIRVSNPFDLVAKGDRMYVTDGGRNLVWSVDIPTGSFWPLAEFPDVPNPIFPALGGPFIEAVPTGIAYSDGQLLVALFRGFPFVQGTAAIEQVDPKTGSRSAFIPGLKDAIDVVPVGDHSERAHLVLQHASIGIFFDSPGVVLRFAHPGGPSTTITNCLTRPTSMVLDKEDGTLYVTEVGGRLVAISTGSQHAEDGKDELGDHEDDD